jgi:hypothetical protein
MQMTDEIWFSVIEDNMGLILKSIILLFIYNVPFKEHHNNNCVLQYKNEIRSMYVHPQCDTLPASPVTLGLRSLWFLCQFSC